MDKNEPLLVPLLHTLFPEDKVYTQCSEWSGHRSLEDIELLQLFQHILHNGGIHIPEASFFLTFSNELPQIVTAGLSTDKNTSANWWG